MSTLLSRKGLAGIRVCAVKDESRGQTTPQLPQTSQGAFSALIATDLEDLTAGDSNLDPITLFEIESLHQRCWQANRLFPHFETCIPP
jgi:hypothetical protein